MSEAEGPQERRHAHADLRGVRIERRFLLRQAPDTDHDTLASLELTGGARPWWMALRSWWGSPVEREARVRIGVAYSYATSLAPLFSAPE